MNYIPNKTNIILILSPLILILCNNCATSMSNFHPADTLPRGDFQVSYGAGLNLPVGAIGDAISTVNDISDKVDDDEQLTEQEQQELLQSALAIAVNPPTGGNEFQFRAGLGNGLEIGTKWAISSLFTDLRYQFLDTDDDGPSGWNASVGFGIGYNFFSGVLFDLLEYVGIDDFYRVDLRIPILFGKTFGGEKKIFHLWFGPLFIASWYSLDEILNEEVTNDEPLVENTSGWWFYYGGQIGCAVGYKYVWLAMELSVSYLHASAHILGNDYNIGGVTIYPVIGIISRF